MATLPLIGERWMIRDPSWIKMYSPLLWVSPDMDAFINIPIKVITSPSLDGRFIGLPQGARESWTFDTRWVEPVNPKPRTNEIWLLNDRSRIQDIDSGLWDPIMDYAVGAPIKIRSSVDSGGRVRGEPQISRPGIPFIEQWTFNINWLDPAVRQKSSSLDLPTFSRILASLPES